MSTAKRIVKNAIILYFADLLTRFTLALVTILIARKLGSADLGRFSYVNSLMNIISTISTFGLTTYIVRQASKEKEENLDFFQAKVFTLRFIINCIFTLGIFFYAQFYVSDPLIKILFHLSNLSSFISIYYTHWMLVFRVREKMKFEGIINIFSAFLYGILGVMLILLKQGIVSFGYLAIFLSLIKSGLFFFCQRSKLQFKHMFIWKVDEFKQILKQVYPFALLTILVVIYFRIDVVFIEHFLGISAVGLYSASYKIMEILMAIPSIFAASILPVISRKLDESPQLILKSSLQAMKWLNIIVFPIAVGGTLLGDKIIDLVYGAKYIDSTPVFQILVWVLIALFNSAITSTIINASVKPIINTYVAFVCLIINVALNIILIPKIGIRGAAIATLANETVSLFLSWLFIKRNIFNLNFCHYLPKIILASLAMGALIFYLKSLYLLPIYILFYFVVVFALRIFEKDDLLLFKKLIPKRFLASDEMEPIPT